MYEYHYKLKNIDKKFYTKRGRMLAKQRQRAADAFYQSIVEEVSSTYKSGRSQLEKMLDNAT